MELVEAESEAGLSQQQWLKDIELVEVVVSLFEVRSRKIQERTQAANVIWACTSQVSATINDKLMMKSECSGFGAHETYFAGLDRIRTRSSRRMEGRERSKVKCSIE